tara:strand:+ start:234 stop:575 length:342 start_codon:yes stop_codon:yes gene_type:complete
MLYQTELPAHSDIIGAFIRDKKLSGLAPTTLEFYHEKLAKLSHDSSVLELTKSDLQQLLYSLTCNQGGKQAYLGAFKAFFNWVEENGLQTLANTNPYKNLKMKTPSPLIHIYE